MPTYRFDLTEEYSKRLESDAKENQMTVQEYIRFKLFNETSLFSVDELIRRIQTGDFQDKEFTVPDIYTEDEWFQIDRATAGSLGRCFFDYIKKHEELGIRESGTKINRRTAYIYKKPN